MAFMDFWKMKDPAGLHFYNPNIPGGINGPLTQEQLAAYKQSEREEQVKHGQ